ncbi:glycoside hydrolase family 2 protein [Dysgonomonas sp. Marseille-P4361]|uniref:glycoside hydrolase family 2 protein n=1 Tax=Dysgonomonas sp. Marseille-P4361 TaxID=2161820 RepID=UPI00135BBBAF|nr:glycoside hydrolase family 2 TIM barrel-domain containing protein [Dysgonomonas sp. Marseille-P4361]
MTSWSENIDPKNVLPEYPRPQMVRNNWINLNGVWDFTQVKEMTYNPLQKYDQKILVPFPMESAISGVMNTNHMENKGKVFAYRKKFSIPNKMKKDDILLHFGAVDWKCEVYVNGKKVGLHTGGFDPFYFNITDAVDLKKKEQEVVVYVQDFQEFGGQLHGKQKIGEKVIWYTPVTGIWQTVWLESVPKSYIEKLVIMPNIDNETVNVKVLGANVKSGLKARVKVLDGQNEVASLDNVAIEEEVTLSISDMKLWSPESPFLYDLIVELRDNGKTIDKVDSYFGMRKISVDYFNGKPTMFLNNKHYFHYGPLDQGYWPDGIYTAPTDEALKFDLEKIKEFGMNMSRKHIKVEPARWYYHCDKMGILVWQDIPNPGFGEDGKIMGDGRNLRENFHDEMVRIMKSLGNHPSVVMWTVYNESWGQPDEATSKLSLDIAREADSTRLISIASGWNDYEYGDIKDTHWYPEPNVLPNPVNKRVSVCGEYGGITLIVDNHRWIGGSDMKYTQVYSSEELKDRFVNFTNQILGLQANGLCAAVYTQITDVEDEENGLITYDRKVVKVNEEQMAEIREAIQKNYSHTSLPIMPVSQAGNMVSKWRYKIQAKSFDNQFWKETSFDDATWAEGFAGFGNGGLQGASENTKWNSTHIYLRKLYSFDTLKATDIDKLVMQVFHDEDCEIYINGILAAKLSGYTNRYEFVEISKEAKSSIKIGESNLIAIKCKDAEGSQFIDLGFSLVGVPIE